jgi:hypothetical protein
MYSKAIEIYLKLNCNILWGRVEMEELSLLGVIYVVVGVVLALFTFITLVLTIVGILLILMAKPRRSHSYAPYPMFMPCPVCGCQIEASSGFCPHCQETGASEAPEGTIPQP